MKKQAIKFIIKAIAFATVFALLFVGSTRILSVGMDRYSAHILNGFYDEEPESLDAVYFGSSNVLAFWNPMLAWEQYGLAVHPYSCNSQPLTVVEYLIKEARKTQPNAVFVVNINTLGLEMDVVGLHRLFDNMPFSLNKLQTMQAMTQMYDLSTQDATELLFPILRYHSRWSELSSADLASSGVEYKGAFNFSRYWTRSEDLTSRYIITDQKTAPPAHIATAVESLFDYCEQEHLKMLFVTVPRGEETVAEAEMHNYINEQAQQRGFPVLDLNDQIDTLQLDLQKDYYNRTHTNVHGSVKFTRFVSEYLIETFGFENKKDNPDYADWNNVYASYLPLVSRYLVDFELEGASRDNRLSEVSKLQAQLVDGVAKISFAKVKGATGYAVYKQVGSKNAWAHIADVKEGEFFDSDCTAPEQYRYRVVPFYEKDSKRVYGNFDYTGVGFTVKKSSQK